VPLERPSLNYLTHLFKNKPFDILSEPKEVTQKDFFPMSVEDARPLPLLVQTGYLIIERVYKKEGTEFFSLKIPNNEINDVYNDFF
jgi:hypothetical protein